MWNTSSDYLMTMEKYLKSQHSLTNSKLRRHNNLSTSAETGSATTLFQETVWTPRASNNGFPRAKNVRRHNINGGRSQNSAEIFQCSLASDDKGHVRNTEKVINLHVPRLSVDNYSTDNMDNKRTFSPFVTNNKIYLQKKGVNINTLYSFKQSRRKPNDKTRHDSFKPGVDQHLLTNFKTEVSDYSKTLLGPDISQPSSANQDTTRNLRYLRLMKGLDRESKIPGHVRPDDTKGNPLGKVLAKTHLESILAKEQMDNEPTFYVK